MPRFDTHTYIKNLGEELVRAYGSAGQATTSGLIGQAREKAVKTKLESILPGGVGVGTGCVIDSEGNSSGQIDVVLYEKEFCPIFCVEDVFYYPCESVIAVGSIKSKIGKKELRDIYNNIASVRRLKRFVEPTGQEEFQSGKVSVRRYLDKNTLFVDGDWTTFQNSRSATQIFAFGLGQAFSVKPETMIKHTKELYGKMSEELRPNTVLTLEQEIMTAASSEQMSYTALGNPGIVYAKSVSSFQWLVAMLNDIIQEGVTASRSAYRRYVIPQRVEVTHKFIPSN